SLAKTVAGPEINVLSAVGADANSPCIIYVGSFDPTASPFFGISVVAEGWRFDCATSRRTQPVSGLDSNPLGPYMAACFAAGAIFKYFWQLDARIDLSATLWDCTTANWDALAIGESPSQ